MIIVSQNKRTVYNFDNINYISIECGNEIRVDNVKSNNLLGTYKTEERAKEVLEEIKYKYAEYVELSSSRIGTTGIYAIPKVYEMPKE